VDDYVSEDLNEKDDIETSDKEWATAKVRMHEFQHQFNEAPKEKLGKVNHKLL